MKRRQFLAANAALIALTGLAAPAWAGHEVDNSLGRYDGSYVGDVRVSEPEKEDRVVKKVMVELQERYVTLQFKDEIVRARYDQIYTMGYKTEISTRHPKKDIRYVIIIEGGFDKI